MAKWQRSFFQPVLPLGEDGRRVTGSKEHIALSRMAAGEGMVLLKNEKNTLPIRRGTKVALFGKGTVDYVKGGGGSGAVSYTHLFQRSPANFNRLRRLPFLFHSLWKDAVMFRLQR